MESNMTVTIFSEEYRDLIKAKCSLDLLIELLIESTDLDYKEEDLRITGSAAKYLEHFAPMAYKMRLDYLLAQKGD